MNIRKYLAVAVATAAVSAFAAAAPAHAATGDISTVAGTGTGGYNIADDSGLATAAQLNNPHGIAVDSVGNLYIAELSSHVIRKITAATGIISTVAGTGVLGSSGDSGLATAAQLNGPTDIAVDSNGNLYVVDSGNNRIRKVTAATGIITTIAGDGTASHTGDGAPATGATLNNPVSVSLDTAGNIYIAEYAGKTVRKITAATGIITTVAGGGSSGLGDGGLATAAELTGPDDAVVDAAGNLYISDYDVNRIRKVTATTGIITTIAGTGGYGFSGDLGLATAAEFQSPGYIALDGDGNVYVADYNNNRIRKITASTGIITTVAGTGARASSGDGAAATAAELKGPWAIEFNTAGDLFIADYDGHSIRKVTGLGAPFTLPPTGASTDGLVWLAAALLGAGVVLVTTRRRHTV